MKKFILALALGSAVVANAQDSEFKPNAGSNNLEFQFAPLGGSPIGISGIRFRRFTTPTSAMRANVFLGINHTSTITQDADNNGAKELKTKETTIDFSVRPGIEKHFSGTDRLSPYVGAEVDLGIRTSSKKQEVQNGTDVAENKIKNETGAFRFGINAVAGFDFYFAKKLYLGAELGFGVALNTPLKTKTTSASTTVESKVDKDNTINFGPNVVSAIRLGYIF